MDCFFMVYFFERLCSSRLLLSVYDCLGLLSRRYLSTGLRRLLTLREAYVASGINSCAGGVHSGCHAAHCEEVKENGDDVHVEGIHQTRSPHRWLGCHVSTRRKLWAMQIGRAHV